MKRFSVAALLYIAWFTAQAQDKVIYLDGSARTGTIVEVLPGEVLLADSTGTHRILKRRLLLTHYRNGYLEQYSEPGRDVLFSPDRGGKSEARANAAEMSGNNLFSVNTLALVNADATAFYERLLLRKHVGAGIMGGVNFNRRAQLINAFLAILPEARKRTDLGVYFNYYYRTPGKRRTFYTGILFKHTAFTFSSLREDTLFSGNQPSVHATYTPAEGRQFATAFTLGHYYSFGENVFIQTIFGLGAFSLKGEYKRQYNYLLSRAGSTSTIGTLPKIYVGINAGFRF